MVAQKRFDASLIFVFLLVLGLSNTYPTFCQNCSSGSLNQANDHYARKRYDAARNILAPLTQCSGQLGADAASLLSRIETEERCQTVRNSARSAILRRNFEQACGFVRQMEQICPDLSELGMLRNEAGGCRSEQAENEKDFAEAIELEKAKEFSEALSALREIKARQPDFPGIDAAIDRVQKKANDHDRQVAVKPESPKRLPEVPPASQQIRQSSPSYPAFNADAGKIEPATEPSRLPLSLPGNGCPYEQYMSQAQDQSSRNNYYRALEWVQKALACRAGNPAAEQVQTEIERAVNFEKAALNDALGKFYLGADEESHTMLHNLVASGKASPQARRLAEYYLAASSLHAYLITGESKPELKSDGILHYKNFRMIPIDTPIPPTGFSPRLLQILENIANLVQPSP